MPTAYRPLFTFLSFLVQQVLVPAVALLMLALIPGAPRPLWAGITVQIVDVGRGLLGSAAAGFALAFAARRFFPSARSGGKWIGVLPSLLMVWALVYGTFRLSLAQAFLVLFFPGPDARGWFLFVILTCPTAAALCYSAAMAWPLFGRKPATQPLVPRG